MNDKLKKYFLNQCEKNSIKIKIVPGHVKNFKSKEEVDIWIRLIKHMCMAADKELREDQ